MKIPFVLRNVPCDLRLGAGEKSVRVMQICENDLCDLYGDVLLIISADTILANVSGALSPSRADKSCLNAEKNGFDEYFWCHVSRADEPRGSWRY